MTAPGTADPGSQAAILVYDTGTGEVRSVPVREAAAGLLRYARSPGRGTAACGEVVREAVQLLLITGLDSLSA